MVSGRGNSAATRKVPLEKNVEMKCLQVNLLKRLTRMTKGGGGIRADKIAGCFNLVVAFKTYK